jgi:hypothetical protein
MSQLKIVCPTHSITTPTLLISIPLIQLMILFYVPASLKIINVHALNEISLDVMSYVNTTLYRLL